LRAPPIAEVGAERPPGTSGIRVSPKRIPIYDEGMGTEDPVPEIAMAAPPSLLPPTPPGQPSIPPLENGDRLTADEFLRRYDAMPHVKKAELIDGVVYMPTPVRFDSHGEQQADLIGWLVFYRSGTPGTRVGDNSTVRLDLGSVPQPDAVLIIDPALGGQATLSAAGYLTAAPELAAEVSASTVSLDLGAKLDVYRRTGVREYVVWRVLDREVDWFILRGSQYERLGPRDAGILASEVFPGLWLDAAALVRGDIARVLEVVRAGIASPEHAAFVQRLAAGR
jgi:hypothetical protein